jgi:small subunit ribosomal protein S16
VLDADRAIYWLNVGAQPTDIVRQILSREGILLRRALAFKGLSTEDINAAVEQHKVTANERYQRLRARRKARAEKAEEATAEAPAAEVVAEAPAAEAVVEAPAAEAVAEAPAAEAAAEAPAEEAPAATE